MLNPNTANDLKKKILRMTHFPSSCTGYTLKKGDVLAISYKSKEKKKRSSDLKAPSVNVSSEVEP